MKALVAILALLSIAASVRFRWDPNAPEDDVQKYVIFQSTNITGTNWTVLGETNGTNFETEMSAARMFFHVKASNFWGLSEPSNVITTPPPATVPAGVKIERKP